VLHHPTPFPVDYTTAVSRRRASRQSTAVKSGQVYLAIRFTTKMKIATVLAAIVFLAAIFIPASHQQNGKPHSWMPQGRFGKRTLEQTDETAAFRAPRNCK